MNAVASITYPKQVKFYDAETDDYMGGIMIDSETIICGCCGALVDIDEIIEDAAEAGVEPIIFLEWIPISDAIIGE